jgi:hypothetical protein
MANRSGSSREGARHQVFPHQLRRPVRRTLRAKLVPASAIKQMQKDGAGFAGFAVWLDMTPAHPDMFGHARSRQPHSCRGTRSRPGWRPTCG